MRSRDLHSIGAPLRPTPRIHRPSSLSHRNSRVGRDVPRRVRERFARESGARSAVCGTTAVLVQHAVDRIENAYGAFRLAARQAGARVVVGENGLMDDEVLKRMLKDVCGEEVLDGPGSP